MRILITIPHYFAAESGEKSRHASQQSHRREQRIQILENVILAPHQLFGPSQRIINVGERRVEPVNKPFQSEVHIVICTSGRDHLLKDISLDSDLFVQHRVDDDPMMLGFQCRKILRDRWGNYDFFCYLEDDLIIHDPWLFLKLTWFSGHVGNENLLLPNRFEVAADHAFRKVYVDGDLAEKVTAGFQDISVQPQLGSTVMEVPLRFHRPWNPHSGCYFLNADQMQSWINRRDFASRDASFIGPLESAATLGVMKAFRIYKPAPENAHFLEIEHGGSGFIRKIHVPKASEGHSESAS